VDDVYMITRGYDLTVYVIWIVIHTVIIGTGLVSLRTARWAKEGTITLTSALQPGE